MKPVIMTETIHMPENGLFGDCMRACVASILELDPARVPHFTDEWSHPEGHEVLLRKFLRKRGLVAMFFRIPFEDYPAACGDFHDAGMDAHHLLGGVTAGEKKLPHFVVGQFGRLVHDPRPDPSNPTHGKLDPDPDTNSYEVGFFVRR